MNDMQTPLALSSWSDREVILALPPLTCDPKILRIALPQGSDSSDSRADMASAEITDCVWVLGQPIYFPRSTPKRQPRLMHMTDDQGGDGYIYLCLGTRNSNETAESGGTGSIGAKERSTESGPVVLRWKVSGTDGWRAWNSAEDRRASELKRESSVWNMLKGRFTDTDKSFHVVTRSGTDWKRKGYLSCS